MQRFVPGQEVTRKRPGPIMAINHGKPVEAVEFGQIYVVEKYGCRHPYRNTWMVKLVEFKHQYNEDGLEPVIPDHVLENELQKIEEQYA